MFSKFIFKYTRNSYFFTIFTKTLDFYFLLLLRKYLIYDLLFKKNVISVLNMCFLLIFFKVEGYFDLNIKITWNAMNNSELKC